MCVCGGSCGLCEKWLVVERWRDGDGSGVLRKSDARLCGWFVCDGAVLACSYGVCGVAKVKDKGCVACGRVGCARVLISDS